MKTTESGAPETTTKRSRTRRTDDVTTEPVTITTTTITVPMTAEERHRLVAEAAYFRALQRNFQAGTPEDDWFAAEAEIEQRLRDRGTSTHRGS